MNQIVKFSDVFKKTFVEGFQQELTIEMMLFVLLLTLAQSFFLFIMYRMTVKDIPFSKGFTVSMAMISVVTCGIILAVQSNIIISLGMVGALSIVRFRTAIKNPMDLLFIFWSISIGIITGAGLYMLSIANCIVIALGITAYQMIPLRKAPKLLIIQIEDEKAETEGIDYIKKSTRRHIVKSRSINEDLIELVIELSSVKNDSEFAHCLNAINGVKSITILEHDGNAIVQ